jgi:arylsulfatase A-like enzyme
VPQNHATAYHGHVELYDLAADPLEQHDLADSPPHAAIRNDLLRRLHRHLLKTADPILQGAVTGPHHQKALALLAEAGK